MTPEEALKKYWGYEGFRPLQRDIISSIMERRDTLGLMPTGGGKSLTFQIPGLICEGLTLVITPLISLMKDQTDNLRRRGIAAVCLHSGMSTSEKRVARERLVNGKAKFLYVSPERISSERFLTEISRMKVNLIVVDEAHCISQWGYDFRPSYLQISRLRKYCPKAPVLALTATATPEVAADIMEQLNFKERNLFRISFARQNISYLVRTINDKFKQLDKILLNTTGSAIVYVRSRKRCREIAQYLEACGMKASYYHAGLDHQAKEERQNSWTRGEVRIMVATNAFGMGIDKPDVRTVIHFDSPPSLEEYYQEAGRAGRDGKPSFAILLVGERDTARLRRQVTASFPDREFILQTYNRICNFLHISIGEGYDTVFEFDLQKFLNIFKLQEGMVRASMRLLEQAGYLNFIEEKESNSRVLVTVDREELYYQRNTGKNTEAVLQQLLRLYPGIFFDYVYIHEPTIAAKSGLSEQQVYDSLSLLSKEKIISYVPRRRTPYVFLPTSREETRYITIGRSIYEDRKGAMKKRVEAMIEYGKTTSSCKVKKMLKYFGEEHPCECGSCDYCRHHKRARNPQDSSDRKSSGAKVDIDQETLAEEICHFISQSNGTTYPIFRKHFAHCEEKALQTLRLLQIYGKVSTGVRLTTSN